MCHGNLDGSKKILFKFRISWIPVFICLFILSIGLPIIYIKKIVAAWTIYNLPQPNIKSRNKEEIELATVNEASNYSHQESTSNHSCPDLVDSSFENGLNFEATHNVHRPIRSESGSTRSRSIGIVCQIDIHKEDPSFEVISLHPNSVNDVQYISIGAETLKEDKRTIKSSSRSRCRSLEVIKMQ